MIRLATDDGLVVMNENVLIGTVYLVDLDSERLGWFFNQIRKVNHQKLIVDSLTVSGEVDGWLPVDLLRIES